MTKETLKKYLYNHLKSNNLTIENIQIETPKQKEHGDLATPIAFHLAKQLKKNPKVIAEELCHQLNQSKINHYYSFTPINGYINIHYTVQHLWNQFITLLETPYTYTHTEKKNLLEYVSANPTGPLHIGHGRWAVIGNVIETLFKETNQIISTEFYINDAGNQIDKLYESIKAVQENKKIPEDGYHGQYIQDIAKTKEDPIKTLLSVQKNTLQKLNITFNTWFSEKTLHNNNDIPGIITLLEKENLLYQSKNATWFKTSLYGDEKDRVLIKSDGSYTYFLVDIAYHYNKIKRGHTHLITILGADHHGYINRISAAVKALGKVENKTITLKIILGQLVSLYRAGEPVKMSKRTGEMITLEEVIDEIGPDATRYYLIEKNTDSKIDFDLEIAKTKSSENPVYYIQYAHARMYSILQKTSNITLNKNHIPKELNIAEKKLMILCNGIHEIIQECSTQLTPYKLAQYLLKLAKTFHYFYETCPIINADESNQQKRIQIIIKTKDVLAYGLKILGISAPNSM